MSLRPCQSLGSLSKRCRYCSKRKARLCCCKVLKNMAVIWQAKTLLYFSLMHTASLSRYCKKWIGDVEFFSPRTVQWLPLGNEFGNERTNASVEQNHSRSGLAHFPANAVNRAHLCWVLLSSVALFLNLISMRIFYRHEIYLYRNLTTILQVFVRHCTLCNF